MAEGNPPDYNVCIARKDAMDQGKAFFQRVGVAWRSKSGKGGIRFILDDGVVLDWRMMETHSVYLFPNWKDQPGGRAHPRQADRDPNKPSGDIPF